MSDMALPKPGVPMSDQEMHSLLAALETPTVTNVLITTGTEHVGHALVQVTETTPSDTLAVCQITASQLPCFATAHVIYADDLVSMEGIQSP